MGNPDMKCVATYGGATTIGLTAEGLARFAAGWPGMGEQSDPYDFRGLVIAFDHAANGDLVDVFGDAGLDPLAVHRRCKGENYPCE